MPTKLKAALIAIPLTGGYLGLLVAIFLAPRFLPEKVVIYGLFSVMVAGVCVLAYLGVLSFLNSRQAKGGEHGAE